jgi:hypothetical protein
MTELAWWDARVEYINRELAKAKVKDGSQE